MKDRAYEIARSCGYGEYQKALARMADKCFERKTGSGIKVHEQLAKELHKPVIEKFRKRKVYARSKGNIFFLSIYYYTYI